MEYFYLEEGQFVTTTGLNLSAKRSYVFRYSETTEKITAWFTKEDRSVDYFFHELEFTRGKNGWVCISFREGTVLAWLTCLLAFIHLLISHSHIFRLQKLVIGASRISMK
jgi:hypothetical protein